MEEQNIPIDINTGKLMDWLVSRRICNRDWPTKIIAIREKINTAIQDMPAHEGLAKLLSGIHINYFHCRKIVEILKETEADSKNLFGRYGSKRMKDWLETIALYEKDNIYLAEAAQMLSRNVSYEVPGIKQQIKKFEQLEKEYEKKESDYKKSENNARNEFHLLCKQLGITGQRIKKELGSKLSELPEIHERLAKSTKTMADVIEYYIAFTEFTYEKKFKGNCVPMVKYVIEKGNTTTYEWKYGEPPISVEEPPFATNFNDDEPDNLDENNQDNIDFGDDSTNAEIDFGDGNIDWGIGVENAEPEAIDFNVSLEESGIVVEEQGQEGGVARNNEALTVLDNPETRQDFINQLYELESFLKMRLYEIKTTSKSNVMNITQLQESSTILQLANQDSTQDMLDRVQVLISQVSDKTAQDLHSMKHSPRYADVLASSLKQKLTLIDKAIATQQVMEEKRNEALEQIVNLQPLLKLVIQRTKELQAEIEQDISKRYKNRIVHLTGGVTTL